MGAKAQNDSEPEAAPEAAAGSVACPDPTHWGAADLHGGWTVALPELGEHGTLVLRRHPEFSASLRGELRIGGHASIASGDLEEGEFNLDESRDGKTLFAFWSGRLAGMACGREIRGSMQQLDRPGEPGRESTFVLRRMVPGTGW